MSATAQLSLREYVVYLNMVPRPYSATIAQCQHMRTACRELMYSYGRLIVFRFRGGLRVAGREAKWLETADRSKDPTSIQHPDSV